MSNPGAGCPRLAGDSDMFVRAWRSWVAKHQENSGEFLDPALSQRVFEKPLTIAEKILSTISNPRIQSPVGMLIWKLREAEGLLQSSPEKPRQPHAQGSGAGSRDPSGSAAAVSAQPPPDPLRTVLPLAVVDRGEAGSFTDEYLFCMSCSLRVSYARRGARASGLDQPLSLHRFARCGCGGVTSIVMHEHFGAVYLVTFLIVRPAVPQSDQPVSLPAAGGARTEPGIDARSSDQPTARVRRFPVHDVRCAGCSDKLSLVLYDPIDHAHHSVEYGCPRCQEIYSGTVTYSGNRLFGCLLRQRP